ncbi:hypothetical protein FWK35_00023312 [Aphis craccivora]|uniref:Uncharacterized protein n=1 Tax=Aphis craccivora TaxID=307492 RepID=A0A6G0Y4J8_APHCR|nr:hypothetical protein FWK35_00023312 [Aphis craccivora]
MLGEILLYKYDGNLEFRRSPLKTHVVGAHREICWDVHEPHGTLTEESVICKCFLDNFLIVGNKRVFFTPIQYERPHVCISDMNLLSGVSYFSGRFHSLKWRLKIEFLINLERKIKKQRHIYKVGDREIPDYFDHHLHTASLALPCELSAFLGAYLPPIT